MFKRNAGLGMGLTVMALAVGVAFAADASRSTEQTINHHLQAISSGNLDAIVGDYAEDAVLIDPSGVRKGKAAIRSLFERMLAPSRKAGTSPAAPDRRIFEGEIGYLAWTPKGPPSGGPTAETYVVRQGLIEAQIVTVAASR